MRIQEGPKQAQSAPASATLRAGNPTNALVKWGDRVGEAEKWEKNGGVHREIASSCDECCIIGGGGR